MGPLLSTMKASAPGLNYRLILVDNHSHDGVEPWRQIIPETKVLKNTRAAALRGQHEPHPGGLDGPLCPGDEHRHVLRSAAAVPGADGRVHGRPSPIAALPAAGSCTPTATTPGPRAASRRCSVILARRFGLGRLMRRTLGTLFLHGPRPGRVVRLPVAFRLFPHAAEQGGGEGRAVRREFRQVFRGRRHVPADGPRRLAGDVSRRRPAPITSSSGPAASCFPPTPGGICARISIG